MIRRALRLAHRGDWRVAPENTIEAMRAALAIPNCDGLELDVRGARDGTPIVLHDETLERVQGVAVSAGALASAELAAHGVPTLADMLAAVGRRPFLDIELKGDPLDAVVDVIEEARGAGDGLERAVVSSFEPETLDWLAGLRPDWPRWLNAEDLSEATLGAARALGCSGISAEWQAVDERSAARVRGAGLALAAWTVRRRSTAARLDRLGVAAICVEASALDG